MTQSPIPVPDPDAGKLIFHCKFLRLWLVTALGGAAWGIPAALIFNPPKDWRQLLFAVTVSVAACGILSALIVLIAPIKFDADKLHGANLWGKSTMVEWQEISSVRRINFFTLPYLKISTPHKKDVIMLPLFLADPHGFRNAVAGFTPPGHPLRLALEKEFQE